MKTYKVGWMAAGALLLGLVGITPTAGAEEGEARIARSIEGFVAELQPATEDAALAAAEPRGTAALVIQGYRSEPGPGAEAAARSGGLAARGCVISGCGNFWISNASSEISRDADGDGFYTRLRVWFDANTDLPSRYVYAKLFVSFEGGPWNLVHTTQDFRIDGATRADEYVIVTELDSGYRTGYYDVLIELYDAASRAFLTDYGPYEDSALRALPLEDRNRDQSDVTVGVGVGVAVGLGVGTAAYLSASGGGAVGLLPLAALAGVRRRAGRRRPVG